MRKREYAAKSSQQLVRKLVAEGHRILTAKDVRKSAVALGLSPGYLNELLFHLVHSGWLISLRRGLYALSSAVPGVSPVHEFEIAMALAKPAAISYWSALHYHGLTEQIPRSVFVTTSSFNFPKTSAKKSGATYQINEILYRFIRVTPKRYFGIEKVWIGDARIVMTDPERTLLDGLMKPEYCGDFAEVIHAFQVHLPKLNLDRIINYALKLDIVTAKRLGWVLEELGVDVTKLTKLVTLPIKGYRPLDPSRPRQGTCNKRWSLQENLKGKIKQ